MGTTVVGRRVGFTVGAKVGTRVGFTVGVVGLNDIVGAELGVLVGTTVGSSDTVGTAVGFAEGLSVALTKTPWITKSTKTVMNLVSILQGSQMKQEFWILLQQCNKPCDGFLRVGTI